MLRDCTEEDFYELKEIAENRLHPDNYPIFLWGALFMSAILVVIGVSATNGNPNIDPSRWLILIRLSLTSLFIQGGITLFFSFPKLYYKFQRLLSVLLSIIVFKISVVSYIAVFVFADDQNASERFFHVTYWLFAFGCFFLVLMTFRGIRRVKQGEFRKGGRLLFKFQDESKKVNVSVIMGAVILSNVVLGMIWEMLVILALAVILQYAIALVWCEFFLLAYCKFRFKSFIVERPVINRRVQKILAENAGERIKIIYGIKLVFIKILQYFLFFSLIITIGVIVDEALNMVGIVIGFGIVVVLLFFLLKWMSQYSVSSIGMYMINAMLGVGSASIIFTIITEITSINYGASKDFLAFLIIMSALFFWFNFNVIQALRNLRIWKRRDQQ